MVTPTYYVIFTFCTLATSVILYQGLKSSAAQIMTMVLAFFVICSGIFVLQMSKVDPRKLNRKFVDNRTTLLLELAKHEVSPPSEKGDGQQEATQEEDMEIKDLIEEEREEPGIDAVRGTMGLGALGTMYRARRRKTISDRASSLKSQRSRARNGGLVRSPGSERPQSEMIPSHGRLSPTSMTSGDRQFLGPTDNRPGITMRPSTYHASTPNTPDLAPPLPVIAATSLFVPTHLKDTPTTSGEDQPDKSDKS